MKKKIYLLLVLLIVIGSVSKAQENQLELIVEELPDKEAYDIKGGEGCNPGDIIITIKSDVPNLFFDSNVMDITDVSHLSEQGEYVFCHSNESFWLTIGSPTHISKKTYIDGKKNKYAFKVVAKAAIGKVLFRTIPNNALVDFGFEGQSPNLSGVPIEMNSGEYKVRISKHGYVSIDTVVLVPSSGNTRQFDISLKPVFAKIQVDVTAANKSKFQIYPTIGIDTARVNLGELMNNNTPNTFDDVGNLKYFKLYAGGIIPVPSGSYAITIEAPGFTSYSTRLFATKGTVTPLRVELKPITAYLTILDNGNSTGAQVYIDNEPIGEVPLYKQKIRIGEHIVRVKKKGYISNQEEYTVRLYEGAETDLSVSMHLFKQYQIASNPTGAEIIIDGKRKGFTPALLSFKEGQHKLTLRKYGYLDHKKDINVDSENHTEIDTIQHQFEKNTPLYISSERKGLSLLIKRGKDTVFVGKTPSKLELPKGKYRVYTSEFGQNTFRGNIHNKGNNPKIKLPSYSRGTFTVLLGDYFYSKPKLVPTNKRNIVYELLATANFGRFNLFPGLSTSILKASVFQGDDKLTDDDIDIPIVSVKEEDKTKLINERKYPKYIFGVSPIFLNGEFRIGAPIFRQLDIAALGAFTFYPKLTNLIGYDHFDGQEIFVGIELSSRIFALNANIKIGQKIFQNASYNYYLGKKDGFTFTDVYREHYVSLPVELNQFLISVGFTLGEGASRANNMIRVVKKPIFANY